MNIESGTSIKMRVEVSFLFCFSTNSFLMSRRPGSNTLNEAWQYTINHQTMCNVSELGISTKHQSILEQKIDNSINWFEVEQIDTNLELII